MTKIEIDSLLNEGFEIGSHAMSHPIFRKLNFKIFEEEIIGSFKVLKNLFKIKTHSFSYPFGERGNDSFEEKLVKKYPIMIKTYLGTKNSLSNFHNSMRWERDNLEFSKQEAQFRLVLLPIFRKFLLSIKR